MADLEERIARLETIVEEQRAELERRADLMEMSAAADLRQDAELERLRAAFGMVSGIFAAASDEPATVDLTQVHHLLRRTATS